MFLKHLHETEGLYFSKPSDTVDYSILHYAVGEKNYFPRAGMLGILLTLLYLVLIISLGDIIISAL